VVVELPEREFAAETLYALARILEKKRIVKMQRMPSKEGGKREHLLASYSRSFVSWKKFKKVPPAAIFRSAVFVVEGGQPVDVKLAFTKFPNLGEDDYTWEVKPKFAYRKVDGSFVGVSLSPDGELLIRSKSSWRNFVTAGFEKFISHNELRDVLTKLAERYDTVMFELVCDHPDKQYVRELLRLPPNAEFAEAPHSAFNSDAENIFCLSDENAPNLKAYLLGARKGLHLVPPEEVDKKGDWPFKPWRIDAKSLEDIMEEVKGMSEEEGVVIWGEGETPTLFATSAGGWPQAEFEIRADPLLKAKNRQYIILITTRGRFFDFISLAKKYEDDLSALPEFKYVELVEEQISKAVDAVVEFADKHGTEALFEVLPSFRKAATSEEVKKKSKLAKKARHFIVTQILSKRKGHSWEEEYKRFVKDVERVIRRLSLPPPSPSGGPSSAS